jgi:hypothetical protein
MAYTGAGGPWGHDGVCEQQRTGVHVEELEAEPAHVHVARGVDDLEAASRVRQGLGVGAILVVHEGEVEKQLPGQVHAGDRVGVFGCWRVWFEMELDTGVAAAVSVASVHHHLIHPESMHPNANAPGEHVHAVLGPGGVIVAGRHVVLALWFSHCVLGK